jgi:hypothetical protein
MVQYVPHSCGRYSNRYRYRYDGKRNILVDDPTI